MKRTEIIAAISREALTERSNSIAFKEAARMQPERLAVGAYGGEYMDRPRHL